MNIFVHVELTGIEIDPISKFKVNIKQFLFNNFEIQNLLSMNRGPPKLYGPITNHEDYAPICYVLLQKWIQFSKKKFKI